MLTIVALAAQGPFFDAAKAAAGGISLAPGSSLNLYCVKRELLAPGWGGRSQGASSGA